MVAFTLPNGTHFNETNCKDYARDYRVFLELDIYSVTAFNSTLNFYFCIDICVGHCMSSPLQCYLRKKGFQEQRAWVLQASSLELQIFSAPSGVLTGKHEGGGAPRGSPSLSLLRLSYIATSPD